MRLMRMLALLMSAFMAGCGGGGSGASVSSSKHDLSFEGYEGMPAAAQTIDVSLDSGSGTVYALASSDLYWLKASFSTTGATTGQITVAPDGPLPDAGTYHATVTLGLCSDSTCHVPVSHTTFPVTVTVKRGLHVSMASMRFSGFEGALTNPQNVNVTLPDTAGALRVEAVDDAEVHHGWIAATALDSQTYALRGDCTSLSAGHYNGAILFTYVRDDGGPSFVVRVALALTVGPGLVQPAAQSARLDFQTSAAGVSGAVAVEYNGSASVAWSASSSQPWLQLVNNAGQTPSALSYRVDLTEAQKLDNFTDHTAAITIRSPGLSDATFNIVLTKALPEVAGVMPYALPANKAGRVLMGGQGFSQPGHPEWAVHLDGLQPLSVQVLSDRQLAVDLPAAPAGSHDVTLPNSSGVATHKSRLVFADTSGLGYAVVPAPGVKGATLFDAARMAVFAIDKTHQSLTRMRWTGATWQVDNLPLASAQSLALGPDGNQLAVGSQVVDQAALKFSYTVNVVDPDALSVGASSTLQVGGLGGASGPLGVTNDGRVWLPLDRFYWDVAKEKILQAPCNPAGGCSADSVNAPADGSFLYIGQSSTVSPAPDLLKYSAASGQITDQAPLPQFAARVALSQDGSRAFGFWNVYDSGMNVIGTVRATRNGDNILAGVMSLDGMRAYQLVFNTTSKFRIDAYDLTAARAGAGNLPVIGSIAVPDAAGDCTTAVTNCRLLLSPDGTTLFWVAEKNLVVIPVPGPLQQSAASMQALPQGQATARNDNTSRAATTRWERAVP